MARFNELLVGRYNRLVQKLFSMKGPASLVTVSDELMPVFAFYNGAEHRYLEGWNLFASTPSLGASVGNQDAFQYRNPVGSNVVAVFTKIMVSSITGAAAACNVSNGAATTDLATPLPLTNARLDPRGNPTPTLIGSSTQAAAPGDLASILFQAIIGVIAGSTPQYDGLLTDVHEVPILPGDALRLRLGATNSSFAVSVFWRERFLEDSERT